MARAIADCKCATCGNEFEVVKVNCCNRRDADNWAAWAAKHYDECKECYHTRKDEERKEANEAAAKNAQERGLAPLKGSPKQIAWAESIRAKLISRIDEYREEVEQIKEVETNEKEIASCEHDLKVIEIILNHLATNFDSASWWIDERERVDVQADRNRVIEAIYRAAIKEEE